MDITKMLYLGFRGQPQAKPLDAGIFYEPDYRLTQYRTKLTLITPVYDSMFLGFAGQPTAKPFEVGSWRDIGEFFSRTWTKVNLYNPVFDSCFLGFDGQPTAKPFETGQWRDIGEVYRIGDTCRYVADVIENSYKTRRIVLVPPPVENPYIDHVERMRQHLISEFQWDYIDGEIWDDKPVIRAILTGLGQELDELDRAVYALRVNRWLDTATGKQLDGIGQIIDRDRQVDEAIALVYFGFYGQPNVVGFEKERFRDYDEIALASYNLADPEYRLVLAMKIRKNSAIGTTEDTIASLRFIFDAPIFLTETGNASIGIGVGKRLTDNKIVLSRAVDLFIRAGGVGIRWKIYFRPGKTFGFVGQPYALGFENGEFADTF